MPLRCAHCDGFCCMCGRLRENVSIGRHILAPSGCLVQFGPLVSIDWVRIRE